MLRNKLGLIVLLVLSACAPESARERVWEKAQKSVVMLKLPGKDSGGTGWLARGASGKPIIVTNAHVCDAEEYLIAEASWLPRPTPMAVKERFADADLCALEVPEGAAKAGQPLELARSGPALHEAVWVAGHPRLRGLTLTEGHMRGAGWFPIGVDDEKCDKPGQKKVAVFFFQVCIQEVEAAEISAAIAPGSSGSPVMDAKGRVVGVAFAGGEGTSLIQLFSNLERFLSAY